VRRLTLSLVIAVLSIVPAAGSASRAPPLLEGRIAYSFRFWPDDPRIGDNYEIFVRGLSGGPQRNVTHDSDCDDFFPAWSRDGRWLAYWGCSAEARSINVVRDDGTNRRQVFAPRARVRFRGAGSAASWSSNGRRLAFPGAKGIWTVAVAGTGARRLSRGRDGSPTWSADSRMIAFDRELRGVWAVHRMSADGKRHRRIARFASNPAWSPDGRRIAFLRRGAVWLMNPDGSKQRRLAPRRGDGAVDVAWSPDSRYVAYEVGCCAAAGHYVVAADGTGHRRLAYVPDGAGFDWGP
jgi:Tol biopolymer transport system component